MFVVVLRGGTKYGIQKDMQKDRNGVRVALNTDRLSSLDFRLISRSVISEAIFHLGTYPSLFPFTKRYFANGSPLEVLMSHA